MLPRVIKGKPIAWPREGLSNGNIIYQDVAHVVAQKVGERKLLKRIIFLSTNKVLRKRILLSKRYLQWYFQVVHNIVNSVGQIHKWGFLTYLKNTTVNSGKQFSIIFLKSEKQQ